MPRRLGSNPAPPIAAAGGKFFRQGQSDNENKLASFAFFAFGPDLAAHHLHKVLANGQPEARAAESPGQRRIALHERLEETLQAGRRDTDAGVPHGKLQS